MTRKNKTLIIRITLLVGTAISLFFVPWLLVKAWILPLPDTIQGQLDQAIDHGFDGMIVYIDQAGQPPQYFASGWHNKESEIPAKPEALFKIASIGKLYDAVAVTKMVSSGRLSLDKTLADYMPELVGTIENAEKITLRNMIQHRSGMPNYTDVPNYWAAPSMTYEEILLRSRTSLPTLNRDWSMSIATPTTYCSARSWIRFLGMKTQDSNRKKS